jgi:hypothetical protein
MSIAVRLREGGKELLSDGVLGLKRGPPVIGRQSIIVFDEPRYTHQWVLQSESTKVVKNSSVRVSTRAGWFERMLMIALEIIEM